MAIRQVDLGLVRPRSRVSTISGEDVARGQVDRSDQIGQRFIAAVDLGARWLAGLLLAVVIVAQVWMAFAR